MATTATQSPFPSDVIAMARRVAGLADIYWAPECFPKEFDAAKKSWLSALKQFVSSYSFERAGAPPVYRTYARRALEKTGRGLAQPTTAFSRAAWNEFEGLARANGHGTNPNVCALYPGKGTHKLTAVEFILSLTSHGHNLLSWATDMLATTRAEDAVRELRRIRGIDYKIATFYLRDVVRAANLEERKAGPGWCFQPIDVWVRRASETWGSLSGRKVTDYDTAAELIIDLADAAAVGGGDLNGGVWILGSQLVDRDSDPDLSQSLASSAALEECLDANLRWSKAIITGIEGSAAGATPSA
jgi:hypothetical protein